MSTDVLSAQQAQERVLALHGTALERVLAQR